MTCKTSAVAVCCSNASRVSVNSPLLRPQLDLAVIAAARQPPVRQHRQRHDLGAVREHHERQSNKRARGGFSCVCLDRPLGLPCHFHGFDSQSAAELDDIR